MKRILCKPSVRILEDKTRKYIYNFGSAELLADGSFFICARQITSLGDPFGRIAAVRYLLDENRVVPAIPPNIRDVQKYPEKGYLMCHVTQLSENNLIAKYVMIDTNNLKPLFSKTNNGMQREVCRISRSADNGETWSDGEDLDYKHGDLIIPGKMQLLSDGTIGFPVEMRNVYDEEYTEGIQARFVYSTDGGKTFDNVSIIPHEPDVLAGDARCTFDDSGNLVIYYWCFDLQSGFDLNNHRTISRDNARTFERIEPIDLHMQITSPMYFDDSTVVAIYQERFSDSCGIKAAISADNGYSFGQEATKIIYSANAVPDIKNPYQNFNTYKFGYSTITKYTPTRAIVVYWCDGEHGIGISACDFEIV